MFILLFISHLNSGEFIRTENGDVQQRVQIRKFQLDRAHEVKARLRGRYDTSLYQFLLDENEASMLRGANVVREMLTALEHDSTEAGLPVVFDLLRETYGLFPEIDLTEKAVRVLKNLVSEERAKDQSDDADETDERERVVETVQALCDSNDVSGVEMGDFSTKLRSTSSYLQTQQILMDVLDTYNLRLLLRRAKELSERLNALIKENHSPLLQALKKLASEREKKKKGKKTAPKKKRVADTNAEHFLNELLSHLERMETYLESHDRANSMLRKILLQDLA